MVTPPFFKTRTATCTLVLALTSAYFHSVQCQRPGFHYPKWARGKFYWISSKSPISKYMIDKPGFNTSSLLIADHVRNVESQVVSFLKNETSPRPSQLFRVCQLEDKGYRNSVGAVFGVSGWPDPYRTCVSDVMDDKLYSDTDPKYTVDQIYDAMMTRGNALIQGSPVLISLVKRTWVDSKSLLVGWSSSAFTNMNYPLNSRSSQCVIHALGFVRIRILQEDKWYISSTLTNKPVRSSPPLHHRQNIMEYTYVHPSGLQAEALNHIVPKYISTDEDGPLINRTSTILVRNRGEAFPASFSSVFPERNIALRLSMEKLNLDADQVVDALSPSQLTILFLPLSLNMIPIYLITPVHGIQFVVHILLSDVLSVIPLAVKGIELMAIGRKRYRSIGTRIIHARNGSRSKAGAAELWAAECRQKDRVVPLGAVFFITAISFMVLGIIGEFWAVRFVRRRETYRKERMAMYIRIGTEEHYDGAEYLSTFDTEQR